MSTKNLRLRGEANKLTPKFIGPYNVVKQLSDVNFEVKVTGQLRFHPVVHVSAMRPYFTDSRYVSRAPVNPPPLEVDGAHEFEVEEVLRHRASRRRDGLLNYFVKFVGYGPHENMWLPRGNLDNCLDLLAECHCRAGLPPVQ